MEDQALTPTRRRSYWRWMGVAALLAGWSVYRLWRRCCERGGGRSVGLIPCPEPAPPSPPLVEPAPGPIELPAYVAAEESPAPEPAPPSAPDDLSRIEGIGPKVAQLLAAAEIRTFAQLAATTPEQLREILQQARLRFMNPETWPEQAALAAQGDWDGLAALQGQLQGGHRIEPRG